MANCIFQRVYNNSSHFMCSYNVILMLLPLRSGVSFLLLNSERLEIHSSDRMWLPRLGPEKCYSFCLVLSGYWHSDPWLPYNKGHCFPGSTSGKEPPCQWRRHETQIWSLGWEHFLKKEMATHSSILAWRIPWTEESGGLQRVGHDWSDIAWPYSEEAQATWSCRV